MPASPTIAFTDSANGGSYTVAVSGSTAGSSNQLKYHTPGSSSWTNAGSRVSDGNITGTLTPGHYFFHVTSSLTGDDAVSNVLGPCAVTYDDDSVHNKLVEAVLANVQSNVASIAVTGTPEITSAKCVRRDEWDPANQDTWNVSLPAIVVTHGEPVGENPQVHNRDDYVYLVNVFVAWPKAPPDTNVRSRHLLALERIARLFNGQRLTGAPSEILWCSGAVRPIVLDHVPTNQGGTLGMGFVQLTFTARETRGV